MISKQEEGWESLKFEQLLESPSDLSYGVVQPGAEFEGGIPLLRVQDLKNGRVSESGHLRIDPAIAAKFSRTQLIGGELLISLVGTVGEVAIADISMRGWNVARAIGVARIRPDIGARWLTWALKSPEARAFIDSRLNTTVQATLNLKDLREVPVVIPPPDARAAIVATLGAIDDKIESNRRIIRLQHQLISLEFEKALSAGTESFVQLQDIAELTKGVSYKSVDLMSSATSLVTLKSIDRNGGYKPDGLKQYVGPYKSTQVVAPGEIVVAQTDLTQGAEVVGRAVRVSGSSSAEKLVASLDLVIARPKGQVTNEYLLGILTDEKFRQYCRNRTNGTTVLHIASDALPSYEAPIVSPEAQEAFTKHSAAMHASIDSLTRQNSHLNAQRDALLPELLSGRMKIAEGTE